MNRNEKIALLTKVLQVGTSRDNRQRLAQATSAGNPFIAVLYDPKDCNGKPTDNTPVHFYDRGQEHWMNWGEVGQYAERYGIKTILYGPDSGRFSPINDDME